MTARERPDAMIADAGWKPVVPGHWQQLRFRHLFRESAEKIVDEVIGPMLSVSGYRGIEVKQYDNDEKRRTDEELTGYRVARPGQLVVNTMWLNYGGLGVTEFTGHFSPAYRSYWIDRRLNASFAHYLLRSDLYIEHYKQYLQGIRPNSLQMPRDAFLSVPVLVPPLEEQRRIAAFLDFETARIDELVREQEDLGRLLVERRTAVVSAAVLDAPDDQGTRRLSDGWTRAKLGYRYAIELGKMLDAKQNIGGNQFPYLRNQDVQWGRINTTDLPMIKLEPDEVSRYTVSDGDILVCEGGDVGRAAIWRGTSGEVAYQKALHRLRPLNAQRDAPEYLVYLLMAAKAHGVFDRDDKRSTIAHLPAEAFRQYRFSFPPLEAQQRIVSRLDVETQHIDALAVEADRGAAILRERRSALIIAAVTGQIDASAWSPPDDSLTPEAA